MMLTRDTGCVGGPKGCIVKIQDAIKKPWPVFEMPPFTGVVPTATTTDALVETVEV
jgi:large subunit ribosomal protein L3